MWSSKTPAILWKRVVDQSLRQEIQEGLRKRMLGKKQQDNEGQ